MTAGTVRDRHANGGQGMNWLRPAKRLACYLRDGAACSYCGHALEDGAKLTLDHLLPHSLGGTNDATNIVTCCHRCNSARGNRDWREFAGKVADYLNHGITAAQIITHIEATVQRPLALAEAKTLIARRGGFTAALKG